MLKQKLQTDQIIALKAKDQIRLDTIRYIVSQIKNKEINTQKELSDEGVVSILQKIKKELHESIDSFTKGGRADLVSEYQKQLDVLLAYLPPEMSDQDLELSVKELIEKNKELFATKPQALIGICVKELKAKADPARIMQMLKKMSPGQSPPSLCYTGYMRIIRSVLFIILFIFLAFSLIKNFSEYQKNMQFYKNYKETAEAEKKRNIQLKTQKLQKTSVREVEKTIRNKLGLLQPSEIAVIIPPLHPPQPPQLPLKYPCINSGGMCF